MSGTGAGSEDPALSYRKDRMMGSHSVRVTAPAKVNLYLAVGARRSDGYHDVTTVLAALGLADTLVIEPAEEFSLICTPDLTIPAEENLVTKAARALGDAAGRTPSVRIALDKRIPHGAGLGGGSSDAAATLVGLATLWDLDQPAGTLEEIASSLGADVPFFLRGGIALYDGRGDRFVRDVAQMTLDVVVVRPDEPVPTAAAYAAFDRLLQPASPGPERLLQALESGDVSAVAIALHNNMTEASAGLVTSVADALAWMRGRPGILGEAMAGSGSAVFGVFASAEDAQACARGALEQGWWSAATSTIPVGVTVQTIGGDA